MATGKTPEHRYLIWAAAGAVALVLGCSGLAACWIIAPSPDKAPSPSPAHTQISPSPSSSVSVELSPSPEPSPVFFKTCTDALRAGVPVPIRSNEPGYRVALDGDEDGKACE